VKVARYAEEGTRMADEATCIIMASACRGMGVDSFMITIHKSYSDYDEFLRNLRLNLGEFIEDIQSILANLRGKEILKPPGFMCLFEAE
jgi:hypothetical protein